MSAKPCNLNYKVHYLNAILRIFFVEWDRSRFLIEEGAFLHMRDVFPSYSFPKLFISKDLSNVNSSWTSTGLKTSSVTSIRTCCAPLWTHKGKKLGTGWSRHASSVKCQTPINRSQFGLGGISYRKSKIRRSQRRSAARRCRTHRAHRPAPSVAACLLCRRLL